MLVSQGDVAKAVGSSVGGQLPVSAAADIEKAVAVEIEDAYALAGISNDAVQEEARLGLAIEIVKV